VVMVYNKKYFYLNVSISSDTIKYSLTIMIISSDSLLSISISN
jgi:hypothetical protein